MFFHQATKCNILNNSNGHALIIPELLYWEEGTKKGCPAWLCRSPCGWAARYFPAVSRSIIAAAGLNFSVRDGKRCAPAPWPPLVSLAASPDGRGGHSPRGPCRPRRGHQTEGPPHKARPPAFRAISAARLNASPRSHLRPIDVVVSHGPQRRPHLGAGFALRCPQRLSPPDAATRLRAWRHDRHTVGPSDPVLSY